MDKFDPNMRGVLFKNDKNGNERRPDYRGSCVINNVDFNVSGWKKVSQKTGDAYLSLNTARILTRRSGQQRLKARRAQVLLLKTKTLGQAAALWHAVKRLTLTVCLQRHRC